MPLREAFSLVGFVYIRDHGIKDDLIKSAMEASQQYFLMPTEVKEAFPRDPDIQQGYVRYEGLFNKHVLMSPFKILLLRSSKPKCNFRQRSKMTLKLSLYLLSKVPKFSKVSFTIVLIPLISTIRGTKMT